jgi:hypothetical protein
MKQTNNTKKKIYSLPSPHPKFLFSSQKIQKTLAKIVVFKLKKNSGNVSHQQKMTMWYRNE